MVDLSPRADTWGKDLIGMSNTVKLRPKLPGGAITIFHPFRSPQVFRV